MFRTLIMLLAVGIVVWLVTRMIKNKLPRSKSKPNVNDNNKIKKIVQCHQCQVFVPEDKTVKEDKLSFCSKQHLDEWKQNH